MIGQIIVIGETVSSAPATVVDSPVPKDIGAPAPADHDVARLLAAIWETMLRQTRYDPPPRVVYTDGVSYHFSIWSDFQDLAGYVQTPPFASTTGLLVKIVETMRLVCDSDVSNIGDQLRAQADALRTRLQQ